MMSFFRSQYEGFDKSADMVLNKVFSTQTTNDPDNKTVDDELCNFDIILGHSQGAILTAALLSIHDKLWKSSKAPLGYILNGSAWPNPYRHNLKSLNNQDKQQTETKETLPQTLFVMGKEDTINPIESAMQVHDTYQKANFDVSIVEHNGGHSVPFGDDEDSIRALEEIVDWIVNIAKQKALRS